MTADITPYFGPEAESEGEAQALLKFIKRHKNHIIFTGRAAKGFLPPSIGPEFYVACTTCKTAKDITDYEYW
jgi:hypothetical protein